MAREIGRVASRALRLTRLATAWPASDSTERNGIAAALRLQLTSNLATFFITRQYDIVSSPEAKFRACVSAWTARVLS